MSTVTFEFQTGIRRKVLESVSLVGEWDNWQPTAMDSIDCSDGCPGYSKTITIDDSLRGQVIRWGLRGNSPSGDDMWLIPTEVKHDTMRDRHREFKLRNDTHHEFYRLSTSRHLGANKVHTPEGELTMFSVWAPHAQNVEVVFGSIWDRDTHDFRPYDAGGFDADPLDADRISGGYIADDGADIHPTQPTINMAKDHASGIWYSDVMSPKLRFEDYDHRLYMFRITREDGSVHYCTDIYARCQVGFGGENPRGRRYLGLTQKLDGSVSCSALVNPEMVTKYFKEDVWPERNFIEEEDFWQDEFPNGPPPRRLEDLVIYELHVGALGFGNNGPGTIEDAMNFLDYLQDLGVNAVELLPMAEFGGGAENWGYATSHYFAIEYAGGGRDKYKFFIRECHRRGMAVLMDVVFNHYVHDASRSQWQADSTHHANNSYYWYEGHPDQYHEFNNAVIPSRRGTGGYVDNNSTGWAPRYYEEVLRQMFISSMVALVEEFHVDGFRVDQTTSIHSYNSLHANGNTVSPANAFGAKFLREMTRTLKMIKPDVILTAEDHSDDLTHVVTPPDHGGLGFDGSWYSNFYHTLIGDTNHGDKAKILAEAGLGDDRELDMAGLGGALVSTGHGRIVYHESHDEAGNGHGTARTMRVAVNGAPLFDETRRYAEARSRWVATVSMLSAGTPMFLFGEEVGAEKDFLYGKVLEYREDLYGMRQGSGRHMFCFYRDLIRLRRHNAGLKSRNIEIAYTHNQNRIIAFRRWEGDEQFLVVGSLNNQSFDNANYFLETPLIPQGHWHEIFNSDSEFYWGWNVGNGSSSAWADFNGMHCVVPANGVVVFKYQN